jgi:hypothetical protein
MLVNYERHFEKFRHEPVTVIEAGLGGYMYPDRGGAGINTLRAYFSKARIHGFDIYDKPVAENKTRGNIYKGSQDDPKFLKEMIAETGNPDIFIDDASHINPLTIKTFEIVFPMLNPGGLYCIEDLETSWWKDNEFKGCKDVEDYHFPSAINLVRALMNDVNFKYIPNYVPKYEIKAIHLYPNLAIIEKR